MTTSIKNAKMMLSSAQNLRTWVKERTNLSMVFGGDENLRKLCFITENNMNGIGLGIQKDKVIGSPVLISINLQTESIVMLPKESSADHGTSWINAHGLSSNGTWYWFERLVSGEIHSGPIDDRWIEAAQAALRIGFIDLRESIYAEDGAAIRLSDEPGDMSGNMSGSFTQTIEEIRGELNKGRESKALNEFINYVIDNIEGINSDLMVEERTLIAGDHKKTSSAKQLTSCIRHLRMARDAVKNKEFSEALASLEFFVERLNDILADPAICEWISEDLIDSVDA